MSKKSKNTSRQENNSLNDTPESQEIGPQLNQMVVFRSAVLAASVVVILAGIRAASSILTPVLLALFVAILLLVPLRWLQNKGIPALASFGIVGGTIFLIFFAIGWVFTNSLHDFMRNSDKYTAKFVESANAIEAKAQEYGYTLWPSKLNEENTQDNNDTAIERTPKESQTITQENTGDILNDEDTENMEIAETNEMPPVPGSYEKLDAKLVMDWIRWGVGQFGHFTENVFLILIVLMFMIFEAAKFPAKLQKAFGGSPITNEHFHTIADDIRRYIVFKAISNALSCVTVTIFYYVIGVEYALLWGVIAFFFYFIPNIGALISAIPPLLLIFVDQGTNGAITLITGLLIIESIIGYGIEPRLLGHGLGISTVVVFLSLIFWGWLLGPIGLFLAAPLTIVVKIILQAFDETRWVAVLLAEKAPR